MKKLIKTTVSIGATEIVLVLVAIVKNKYLALTVGVEGLGIFGLIQSFFNIFIIFAGYWLATGVTKYTSEFNKKNNIFENRKIFSFSITITLFISLFLCIIFIILETFIRTNFLSDKILREYFILYSCAFVGTSLRPIFLSSLQGLMKFRSIIIARISISIVEILLIIIFVFFLDLRGFFISIFLTSIFSTAIFLFQFKNTGLTNFVIPRFTGINIYKKLLNYGLYAILSGFVYYASEFIIRKIVLINLGLSYVGLLFALYGLMHFAGVIRRGALFYLFPKISTGINNTKKQTEINNYLFMVQLTSVPILLGTILFGYIIIELFYSSDFILIKPVIFWFMINVFISNILAGFQSTLISINSLKKHLLFVTIMSLCNVIIPLLLISTYQLHAVGIGLLISSILGTLLYYHALTKKINFKIDFRNTLIMIIGIFILGCTPIIVEKTTFVKIIYFLTTCSMLIIFINSMEWQAIFKLIKNLMDNDR